VQFSPDPTTAQGGTGDFADLGTLGTAGRLVSAGGGNIDTGNIVNWHLPTQIPAPGTLSWSRALR
jgi:hypothetical protein